MGGLEAILQSTLELVSAWWWVIIPIAFVFLVLDARKYYKDKKKLEDIDWVLLQLTVPQEVAKSPLAMEQVFSGLHTIEGEDGWFSFELRSVGGAIALYLRTPAQFRNLVESHIYAQYPDAEIQEIDDYVDPFAEALPTPDHDLHGAEFNLKKEDAYPIRVWQEFKFETEEGIADIDPMAALIEALSKLRDNEQFWLQLCIKPVDDEWKEEGEKIRDTLLGREPKDKKKQSEVLRILTKEAGDIVKGTAQAPFGVPTYGTEEGKDNGDKGREKSLSPGEREVVEALERNIAKVGFKTTIRAIYLAPKDVFDKHNFTAITSAFRQYSTQNLNAIELNKDTGTAVKGMLADRRSHFRKKQLLHRYKHRAPGSKEFIFSTEELATLFHFPGHVITSPSIPRIETKKGEPPSGLPTHS